MRSYSDSGKRARMALRRKVSVLIVRNLLAGSTPSTPCLCPVADITGTVSTMSATGPSRAMARFDLVVVVASLGGLNAISAVLTELPAAFPVSLVVVQH